MDWNKLLNANRFGQEQRSLNPEKTRSQFQRDYDRIIFASAFRRLQNKTQVFPLPGSVYVHNRLTHSLEVASVGRSLGRIVADFLAGEVNGFPVHLKEELPTIVATACLCHDMGNPPFGHSGEDALSMYFREGKGMQLESMFDKQQWNDLCYFEGNANVLRMLTHQYHGRRKGGFVTTYATLASVIKYPYSSMVTGGAKYGFFASENQSFIDICRSTGLAQKCDGSVVRHPLVYLVEAADDISYLLMDMEDAYRLKVLSYDEVLQYLAPFYESDNQLVGKLAEVQGEVTDKSEVIAFLRASIIGKLIDETAQVFIHNYAAIMQGAFKGSLYKKLPDYLHNGISKCKQMSVERIYNHRSVVKVQLAGYHVLGTLLEEFVGAVLNPDSSYNKQLLSIIPSQYFVFSQSKYDRLRYVLDFISGMTDLYAVQLYRDIRGIDFERWPV